MDKMLIKMDSILEASDFIERIGHMDQNVSIDVDITDLVNIYMSLDEEKEKEQFLSLLDKESNEKIRKLIDGGIV